jgi:transcriptional regulator GlxA family with amidase domain
LRRTLYEIDRDRVTCAGGIAALDMMTAIIARDHGPELAAKVSDWFLQPQPRLGTAPQRMALQARTGIANAHVLAALSLMEANIETPLSVDGLAGGVGISGRHLERLFREHADAKVAARYLEIRLERARSLLRETSLPLNEIVAACGFQSASHFSRRFAARYGRPPSRIRGG